MPKFFGFIPCTKKQIYIVFTLTLFIIYYLMVLNPQAEHQRKLNIECKETHGINSYLVKINGSYKCLIPKSIYNTTFNITYYANLCMEISKS